MKLMYPAVTMLKTNALKQLIDKSGRTRKWLASQIRVEPETITHYLSGNRQPSAAVIKLLSMALEVPETEIWDDEKQQAS